jgi:hypothetical protein
MGSDIHIFLEKNTSLNGVSKWVNTDYWKLNPYYDGVDEYEDEYEHVSVYRGRDYTLFNILAGVRGAGHDMIDVPRGVPEDISPLTKKQYEKWSSDGHNHSYFTLFE